MEVTLLFCKISNDYIVQYAIVECLFQNYLLLIRSLNAVLLTLILIGTLLEAWRIYALKQNKWTDSSNIDITNFDIA